MSSPTPFAIVTGASRGMGAAIAQALLESGHRVLCISRNESDALARVAHAHGVQCEQWRADLADPAPVAKRSKSGCKRKTPAASPVPPW